MIRCMNDSMYKQCHLSGTKRLMKIPWGSKECVGDFRKFFVKVLLGITGIPFTVHV